MIYADRLTQYRSAKQQRGLTLIEVLVAVIILAIGLLGQANLQALGIKNMTVSGYHSQATILANSLLERMHINSDNAADYVGFVNASCPGAVTTAQLDYCDVYAMATGGAGGTRVLRAPLDGTSILSIIPCAACPVVAGMYTLTVSWTDTDSAGVDQTRTYALNFNP